MCRLIARTIVCFVIVSASSSAYAEGNPFSALWPFGKSKATSPNFDNIDPFKSPSRPVSTDKTLGLPSPAKIIDGAEKRTNAVFKKTRESLKDIQAFGKSLNPFSGAGNAQPKQKKSLLDTIFPKQTAEVGSPATMNDFMKLKRPKF